MKTKLALIATAIIAAATLAPAGAHGNHCVGDTRWGYDFREATIRFEFDLGECPTSDAMSGFVSIERAGDEPVVREFSCGTRGLCFALLKVPHPPVESSDYRFTWEYSSTGTQPINERKSELQNCSTIGVLAGCPIQLL